jgi:CubicO group peptidase (beta-lactamase class C family)
VTVLAAIAAAAALTATQHAAIDTLVTATMKAEHIAGATVAVSIGGNVAYEKAFGYADMAARTSASVDTIYPIGSITKQFTAACILLLAQDGNLSIDDPLSQYVSGLPWANRVTLRHLLDQESGVVDFRIGVSDVDTSLTHTEVIDRLKQTDLLFPPGSKYEYSNSNYYLLGLVVERVSGKSYPAFLRSRVLVPLGLQSTFYNDGSAGQALLAHGHNATANGPQPVPAENPDWAYAAGAIASTVSDMVRWDEQLRGGKLLSDASRLEMFTPGRLDDDSSTDYAFGWVVVKHNGRREVWHNGEVTGFHAMNATYPDDRTDIVVLTNTGGTFAADELAVRIFDTLHPLVPSASDRAATGRAKEWLGRIVRDDVDRTQLTDAMNATLSDAIVKAAGAQLQRYGQMKSFTLVSTDQDASGRSYAFKVTFARHAIRWLMGIDARGKISALTFHL